MDAVRITGQIEVKPPKRQPAAERLVLDEDSPFLLLATSVVQQARMDRAHRCSRGCKPHQCQRARLSAQLFLEALCGNDPAWGGVWLDWLEHAAARADPNASLRVILRHV